LVEGLSIPKEKETLKKIGERKKKSQIPNSKHQFPLTKTGLFGIPNLSRVGLGFGGLLFEI
jgi:hypothetical protein